MRRVFLTRAAHSVPRVADLPAVARRLIAYPIHNLGARPFLRSDLTWSIRQEVTEHA